MSSTFGFSTSVPTSNKTSVRNRTTTLSGSSTTAIQGKANQEIMMSNAEMNPGNPQEISAGEIGRTDQGNQSGQTTQGQGGQQGGQVDPTDFVVTTEPPKFVSGQGRGKSAVRIAIENLEPGQYLKVGPVSDKLKNSTRAMAASVQTEAKTRGVDVSFLIREDEQGNLWVGRRSVQSDT